MPVKLRLWSGVRSDLRARLPLYGDDMRAAWNRKVLSATVYMFFTNLLPAITFGFFLTERTNAQMGVIEVLLSMGVSGVLYGVLAGQPLVIVGVTGPISIFYDTMFDLAASWGYPFLPWMTWVSIWAALLHVALAMCNASNLVRWTTRFSGEIFGTLIALVYVARAVQTFVLQFAASQAVGDLAPALLSLLLGLGMWAVAAGLASARTRTLFNKTVRGFVADYAAAASIVLFTSAQFLPALRAVDLDRLLVPSAFEPTTARAWLVPFWEIPVDGVFAALLPALILTALFFFDHNVSSMLSQLPEFHLRKPPSYNWDIVVLGLTVLLTGLLGLPANNGLIPQSPLHVRALATIREVRTDGSVVEVWDHVCENRVSAIAHAVLIGVTCAPPFLYVLSWIPSGVLAGLFLYIGFASFQGNELAERTALLVSSRKSEDGRLHGRYLAVPPRRCTAFTAIQLGALAAILGVTYTPAAIAFPIFIVLLVPLRLFGLTRIFSGDDLALLDEAVPRRLRADVADAAGPPSPPVEPAMDMAVLADQGADAEASAPTDDVSPLLLQSTDA